MRFSLLRTLSTLFIPIISTAHASSSSFSSFQLVLDVCGAPSSKNAVQAFNVNDGNIGVVSVANSGCLNNAGENGPLTIQQCVGGDQEEIGYNLTNTSSTPVEWQSSNLCWATSTPHSPLGVIAPLLSPLTLQQCSFSSHIPSFQYQPSSSYIQVVGSALCITALPPPPPLLSTIFGSHMVIQRDAPFTLFGTTSPSATVNITFAGITFLVVADAVTGEWESPSFPPMPPSGPYNMTAVSSSDPETSTSYFDIYIGLRILCSGQSNMSGGNTPVSYIFNATQEIADSSQFPMLRIFTVGTYGNGSYTPLRDLAFSPRIPWSVSSPSSVPDFSAVCYLTGRNIAAALGNSSSSAIGLVESAWGGTSIQVWLNTASYEACGGTNFTPPAYPGGWPVVSMALYNGMIAPFLPLPVGGFVWLQGESNALNDEYTYYSCALPQLIQTWRNAFQSPSAWFGVVQLAPWISSSGANQEIAELRNVELVSVGYGLGLNSSVVLPPLANVTVATAADGGDPYAPLTSIHPRAKQGVGKRLGLGALWAIYRNSSTVNAGNSLYASQGPIAINATAGGGPTGSVSATVTFINTGPVGAPMVLVTPSTTGPFANSSVCPTGVPTDQCAGFQVQDSVSGVWYNATPSLSGGQGDNTLVLVVPDGVAPPGTVLNATACGWAAWPVLLLYNSLGVVAYPFYLPIISS